MMLFLAEDDLVIKDQIHLVTRFRPSSSRSVCCLPCFGSYCGLACPAEPEARKNSQSRPT